MTFYELKYLTPDDLNSLDTLFLREKICDNDLYASLYPYSDYAPSFHNLVLLGIISTFFLCTASLLSTSAQPLSLPRSAWN